MSNAKAVGDADEGQAEKAGISRGALQQFRIGDLQILQSGVHVGFAFGVEQRAQAEAVNEALDLAGRHRFVLQVDQVNGYAALFEEAFGSACRLRTLYAEDLDVLCQRCSQACCLLACCLLKNAPIAETNVLMRASVSLLRSR